MAEITDALELLNGAEVHFADTVPLLERVAGDLTLPNGNPRTNNPRLTEALDNLVVAQGQMVTRGVL